MERFLLPKEKGEAIWRSIKEGPNVPVRTTVRDVVAQLMGQDEQCQALLTVGVIEKLHADQVAFSEMVLGVPPSLFEHIQLCKSTKEIWDTLQDLFDGLENMNDKRMTSTVNEFDMFTTTPSESVCLSL